jgi:hypothetical protein
VLYSGDLDAGRSGAGQRGEQYAPERVAERRSVSALERLDDILSVSHVTGSFDTLYLGLLNFNHAVTLLFLAGGLSRRMLIKLRMIEGSLLLGVQLDDKVLLDGQVDVVRSGILMTVASVFFSYSSHLGLALPGSRPWP